MYRLIYILFLLPIAFLAGCDDDDSFSASYGNMLTLSVDTVRFDTVFTRVPTSTKDFWVFNNSGDGIRCSNVRLERGNQSGFRVNVDGSYLGEQTGYKQSNLEIRKGDSIRVFVEYTSVKNNVDTLRYAQDNIVFQLESGRTQRVNLNAWTWDADTICKRHITGDVTLDTNTRPLIVYDSLIVDEGATLTITKGSTIYFHDKAGIYVHGRLICQGDSDANITLRGYRLDRMFPYLPYDRLPGHWKGVRFYKESYDNIIDYTDLHSAYDAIICDSSALDREKLVVSNSIVHNCQGYGVYSINSNIRILNSQISNMLRDCVRIVGGNAIIQQCTIAQFYPFVASRGAALGFTNGESSKPLPLRQLDVFNTIITGYNEDVLKGSTIGSDTIDFRYSFVNCLLRTREVSDDENFKDNIWEDSKAEINGTKHFVKIDTDNFIYDFHLDSLSTAIASGDSARAIPYTRDGKLRDHKHPNIGCY